MSRKNVFALIIVCGVFSSLANAEESATQKIKNMAHDTKDSVKGEWKKAKPKIKSAFKDAGHSVADGAKKVAKDLK